MSGPETNWKQLIIAATLGAIATLLVTQIWELLKLFLTLDWTQLVAFLSKNPSGQISFIPLVVQFAVALIYAIRFRIGWKDIVSVGFVSSLGMFSSYFAILSLHLFLGTAEPILSEMKESPWIRGLMFGVVAIFILFPFLVWLITNGADAGSVKRQLREPKRNLRKRR